MSECVFCKPEEILKKRIIHTDSDGWYAFVPDEPEIFGHIIVTVKQPHIREIISEDDKTLETLQCMTKGVKYIADILRKIKNVQRVYFAMLGETEDVHMHYHVFPRYGFVRDYEIDDWAKEYHLSKGFIAWQRFYSQPTVGFTSLDGFQYLGEIEKAYTIKKREIGSKPSNSLVEEMVEKIINMIALS